MLKQNTISSFHSRILENMDYQDLNFAAKPPSSRLTAINCTGYTVADSTKPVETKVRTYIFPKFSPAYKLEMEAESSIPLWGYSKTNSIRLLVETWVKRAEIKELISLWRVEGKVNIPEKR
jgi:hypothetical protein